MVVNSDLDWSRNEKTGAAANHKLPVTKSAALNLSLRPRTHTRTIR